MWCIFSIYNEYNQPDNNLEAWWKDKPSLEMLFEFFKVDFKDAELIVKVAQMWESEGKPVDIDDKEYRLQKVEEGILDT